MLHQNQGKPVVPHAVQEIKTHKINNPNINCTPTLAFLCAIVSEKGAREEAQLPPRIGVVLLALQLPCTRCE